MAISQQTKWSLIMKLSFLALIAALMLMPLFTCSPQTSGDFEIYWPASPVEADVVGYRIYLESRPIAIGFTLTHNMTYTIAIDEFEIADTSYGTQTGELTYPIKLDYDGKYHVSGIIAYKLNGRKSQVGTNLFPFLADTQPPTPGGAAGVGIREVTIP